MYYYTYLVIPTNENSRLFGKIYFGKHKTEKLDDLYIGSGKVIRRYIKKYPNEYCREIISFYSSEEELNKAEYELIHPHLNKDYCLNLQEGGIGGSPSVETRKLMSLAKKGKTNWSKGIPKSKEQREKISKTLQGNIPWNKGKKCQQLIGEHNGMYHKRQSEEGIERIRQFRKSLPKEKHPMYANHMMSNYKWVSNGIESFRIKSDEVQKYIETHSGFHLGRK